ncbi:hypothetical protein [Paraburkholderia sp. J67]|uniref:hypothetical protein n=1 Tax=Paraburkholderia sp. J67 TaxID=2805435 RepID=UPI002ABD21F8|nr:hypothetical protein [Paraburkholderia sp. J67]
MKRASWIVCAVGAIGALSAGMLAMPAHADGSGNVVTGTVRMAAAGSGAAASGAGASGAGASGAAASAHITQADAQKVHKADPAQVQQKTASAAPSHAAPQRRAPAAPSRARAAVPDDTPFAFRGISLGITLTALREANMVRATPHESTLICETDVTGGSIGMMLKSDGSPTIACRWAHRTSNGWAPSLAVVAGAPAIDHVLRFAHDAPGEPLRLYEMSFVVDSMTAFDLRDLLAARYGKPHMRGNSDVPLLEWDNASSTITICVLPDGGRATLTYLLKPSSPRPKGFERALKVSQFDEG